MFLSEGLGLLSKSQIDKIGDRIRAGNVDADALRSLEDYRSEFTSAYRFVERTLRDQLGHAVTGRPAKSTLAIIDKLNRQKTRLTQIQDIAGCRVVVGSIFEQDSLVGAANVMFDDVQVDDKRDAPTNAYRAVHLIVKRDGKLVEVQVRTRLQHAWAEISEKLADAYGHELKYGSGEEWAIKFLSDLSAQIALLERLQSKRIILDRNGPAAIGSTRSLKKTSKDLETRIRHELYKVRGMLASLNGR